MSKTKIEETNSVESYKNSNEALESSKPVKVKLEVKSKLELSDKEKKVLHWHAKGQSVHWIATALQLHQNKVKEIIDANV